MAGWTVWIFFGAAAAAFLILKQRRLSTARAKELFKSGAIVIDVRSKQEFREQHLPKTLNIPLDELDSKITRVAPDKSVPILVHCLSGGRSAIARLNLKRMGYSNVSNLGSYARARKILGG